MSYEYKDPMKDGFSRVYLTKAEHKKAFPYRKKTFKNTFRYFVKGSEFIIEEHPNMLFKLLVLLLLPVAIIAVGFLEFYPELLRLLFPKKYGSFSSDTCKKDNVEEKIGSKL